MGKKRKNQPGYVQTKDSRGRTIWVPDGSQQQTAKPLASHNALSDFASKDSTAENSFSAALESIGQQQLSDLLTTTTTTKDGNIVSSVLEKPTKIQSDSGRDYQIASVHMIDNIDDLQSVEQSLKEAFMDTPVKKPRSKTKPSQGSGRSKRLVITPDNAYVTDAGSWDSPFGTVTTSATVSLDDDDFVSKGDMRTSNASNIEALMAEEIVRAIDEGR